MNVRAPAAVAAAALTALVTAACGDGRPTVFEVDPIEGPGRYSRQLVVDGFTRWYGVYVPEGVDPTRPTPVLLVFHGAPKSVGMEAITGMNDVADELGFVAVYPSAFENDDWAHGCGSCTAAAQRGIDDVGYTRALLDQLSADMAVDADRVYATGFSQGGMMVYRLACDLSDRITAFAPVGSGMWDWHRDHCAPARPFPLLAILGTEDVSFPWEGVARSDNVSLLPAEVTLAFWLERNGCPSTGVETALPDTVDDGTSVHRVDYAPCADGTVTRFYRIEGGGHTWPRSPLDFGSFFGRETQELDASRTVAEFLLAQRR